jgi:phage tail-like protein
MARSCKLDPIEKFRFTVDWDGLTRAGFSSCGSPKKTINQGTYREGNAPDVQQKFAGITTCEDITLERGVTTNQDFYNWVLLVHNSEDLPDGLPAVQPLGNIPLGNSADYKKDIIITVWSRDGVKRKQWKLFNAFPVAFSPGSDMAGGEDDTKSLESITLSYEDFTELTGSEIEDGEDMVP